MTNRSRYSTAPTYGMQKRPAPKKQAAPAGPVYPPAGPATQGPYAPPVMPGYANPGGMMPQATAHMPQQPAYASQPAGFAPQPGYAQRQPGVNPQVMQKAIPMQQPMPYYPQQQPYPPQPVPQEYAVRPKSRRGDSLLQILLLAVLPILFVLTLLIAAPFLKIAFISLGVLALIAMWMQGAFVPSARATLTLVYGALILVCVVSLITGNTPRDTTTSARGNGSNAANQQQSNTAPTNSPEGMVQMGSNSNVPTPGPAPTSAPESGTDSAAWQSASQFFNYWIANQVPNMLTLVSPSWKAAKGNPEAELFLAMANRIPLDYEYEKISGSDADSSRTVTMTANIDKRNGRDPIKIRFQVIVLKVNGQWYVDPESIRSNAPVEDTPAPGETGSEQNNISATATPKPEATPGSKTKLYYNSKGGRFYHANSECPTVAKEYLPLDDFYYKDLNNTKYKNLLPCPDCKAPSRPE